MHRHATAKRARPAYLVSVSWANEKRIGHRASQHEGIDWLVGGAILAQTDGVVRKDVRHAKVGDCTQPNCWQAVLQEAQERRSIRTNT